MGLETLKANRVFHLKYSQPSFPSLAANDRKFGRGLEMRLLILMKQMPLLATHFTEFSINQHSVSPLVEVSSNTQLSVALHDHPFAAVTS